MPKLALFTLVSCLSLGCVQELAVLGTPDGGARDTGAPSDGEPPVDAMPDAGGGSDVVRAVAAGVQHSCAIIGGTLYCWGANERGQLGLGDTTSQDTPIQVGSRGDWEQIAAGEFHSCGITADGALHCWGGNAEGQVGVGDAADRLEPAAVSLPLPARYVDVGYNHSCAILDDRSMSCWGDNAEGQLGLDDWTARSTPTPLASGAPWLRVALGQATSIASTESGALWGWGRNSENQVGLGPGALIQRQSPTFISDGSFDIVAATQNTSGALMGGDLYAWGDNFSAQFGDGTRTAQSRPVLAVGGRSFVDYELGTFSGCAIAEVAAGSGTLHCWGRNAEGQLGTGDNDDQLSPTQAGTLDDWVQVSVGRFHVCARRADDSVYCSGENREGRLGTGDINRRNAMTPVAIVPL